MFSGAQFSIYPMSSDFIPAIMRGIAAIDGYGDRVRRETDELSTLIVGPPDTIVHALRDAFVAVAKPGGHVVLSATLSRGCPGESDDPICAAPSFGPPASDSDLVADALRKFHAVPASGVACAAQISLYPLGTEAHMARIGACIDFLKAAGVYDRSKNFCSKLRGDAGSVFAAIERAFLDFVPASAHVVLAVTISAGSPTKS